MRSPMVVVLAMALVGAALAAQESLSPAEQVAILERLAPSLVRVEYTLQFDKGEAPQVGGVRERCPRCGQYHGFDSEELVVEERPLERMGFLVAPDTVVAADPLIHPRFVKGSSVRLGPVVLAAQPAAYARDRSAAFLKLSQPLEGARPLEFGAVGKPPYLALTFAQANGAWKATLAPLATSVSVSEDGRRFVEMATECLVVDAVGTPLGIFMGEELPPDGFWEGSPLNWPVCTVQEMSALLNAIEKASAQGLPRVTLSFRSPRKAATERPWHFREREDEEAPERHVVGVLLDERQVLILADLEPSITARLERIVVHPAQGEAIPARFVCTLADYGCLLAALESPLPGAVKLSPEAATRLRNALMLSAEVRQQGEDRVTYVGHARIPSFQLGWRRQVYPELVGRASDLFLFDQAGNLAALPVTRREKPSVEEQWRSEYPQPTPVAYLLDCLRDPAKYADPNNVPLSEEEESRLAWLGVELQPLNAELARANKVSQLTQDGRSGTIVSFVYPDSPAAKAGILPGFILLRLHVEGHPKPLDVTLSEYEFFGDFPWDRLDDLPEDAYDQIPTPWPSVENELALALTQIGFGKKFRAEFFHDGKLEPVDFVVEKGPTHYGSAPRYKSDPLGLTVRELTYEVRHYFRKKDEEPGMIISKVEPGSKASVGGIKPFEIITAVNETPVRTVEDFQKLTAEQEEIRLSVVRMTRGRIVTIKMAPDAGEEPPAQKPE